MGKYKEIFNYLVFGGLTTLVNIASYYVCVQILHIDYKFSTTYAWILSVVFAYVTNKLFVFNSRAKGFKSLAKEIFSFFFFRLLSYFLDLGTMILLVGVLTWNDLWAKIIANGIVIVFNYAASKLFIFKKKQESV